MADEVDIIEIKKEESATTPFPHHSEETKKQICPHTPHPAG